MSVRVTIATSTEELDAVFRLRNRIFMHDSQLSQISEAGKGTWGAENRFYDRWDAFPVSANLTVFADGTLAGAVRCTEPSSLGLPHDEYYDCRPFLPAGARPCSMGLLCIERAFRWSPQVAFSLTGMACAWAMSKGFTHMVSVALPNVLSFFLSRGFRQVGPPLHNAEHDVHTVPVICGLNEAEGPDAEVYREFARRHAAPQILQGFTRQFHVAGETVFRSGDLGEEMFVVIAGRAVAEREAGIPVAELVAGDVFGEDALQEHARRAVTVRADAALELMVVDRRAVHDQLRDNDVACRLTTALAARLAKVGGRQPDAKSVEAATAATGHTPVPRDGNLASASASQLRRS